AQRHYKEFQKLDAKTCAKIIDKLNSGKEVITDHEYNVVKFKERINNLPEFTLFHALRLISHNRTGMDHFSHYYLTREVPPRIIGQIELRQLEQVL
ncbi:hypothetical protein H3265_24020, partial [Escherichia coli]